MIDRTGMQLGNYLLTKYLGGGGFADVYLGEHKFLKSMAAIKVLKAQLTQTDQEDFINEARFLARLIHPNIVRVLEFGIETGQTNLSAVESLPFLVIDYAPRGTLRTLYKRGTRLPLALVVSYVKQVASALQYAHDKKLIHRDVKPDNMLMGHLEQILLSDFGLVTFARSSHSLGTREAIGTLPYMSPEQINGQPHFASDQYALGVVTYEWLTGHQPFTGNTSEIVAQHLHASPQKMSSLVPNISPQVDLVVMKALEKDLTKRFGSIQEFATSLDVASQALNLPSVPNKIHKGENSPLIIGNNLAFTGYDAATVRQLAKPDILPIPVTPAPNLTHLDPQPTKSEVLPKLTAQIPESTNADTQQDALQALPNQQQELDRKEQRAPRFSFLLSLLPTVQPKSKGGLPSLGTTTSLYNGHKAEVYSVAWSPDGKRIASASADDTARIWDAATGRGAIICHGHEAEVYSVAWSPDGKRIASASADGTARIWDAATGNRVDIYREHKDWVRAVSWSPDGRHVASASNDKIVRIWDAATGNRVGIYHGHEDWVRAVSWSSNGGQVASASNDKTVRIWDVVTGKNMLSYSGHFNSRLGGVHALAWSSNDSYLASCSEDQTVQIWDAYTGKIIYTYNVHSGPVSAISWYGQSIASGSYDTTVHVWQTI